MAAHQQGRRAQGRRRGGGLLVPRQHGVEAGLRGQLHERADGRAAAAAEAERAPSQQRHHGQWNELEATEGAVRLTTYYLLLAAAKYLQYGAVRLLRST
eukprot:4534855-Prymnesium_polylepis.1